jgi:hypothetical protein
MLNPTLLELSNSHKPEKKHVKIINKTLQNNIDSDYTEKIRELDNQFNYTDNSDYYWGPPEQSILYGTPIYEQASSSQKKVLNHLYWVMQYNSVAVSELNTIIYNQITADVFATVGHQALYNELQIETEQERHHINAFQRICHRTQLALLGKNRFSGRSQKGKSYQLNQASLLFGDYQESALRFLTKMMLKDKEQCYSQYLSNLDKQGKSIPAPKSGFVGRLAPNVFLKFFTLNWVSSPFIACQYYVFRYIANMIVKNQELRRSQYFMDLEKKGEFIPVPTAISRYHFLDEAFHTTISQTTAPTALFD